MNQNQDDTVSQALDAVNAGRHDPYRVARRFDVGAKGAYFVESNDGDFAVLKSWPNTSEQRDNRALRQPRIDRLRNLGWPIPALLHTGSTPEVLFDLWAMAPGEPGVQQVVPVPVIEQAERLIGAARGGALGDGSGWPGWLSGAIQQSIERATPNARPNGQHLLDVCRKALEACDVGPGRDIIHGDFGPANCLIEGGRIVAVVDFDDCRDGDGTLDLAGLAWDLEGWEKAERREIDRVWRRVRDEAGSLEYARVLVAFWVAGSLAWSAGTSDEPDVVACSRRALDRLT